MTLLQEGETAPKPCPHCGGPLTVGAEVANVRAIDPTGSLGTHESRRYKVSCSKCHETCTYDTADGLVTPS